MKNLDLLSLGRGFAYLGYDFFEIPIILWLTVRSP